MRVKVITILAVLLGCVCSASAQSRAESSWEALQRIEKYDRALVVAVREAQADEESWWWALSAAKSAGRLGDGPEAGKWLTESAARGYSGINTVENAAEFESVRQDEGFLAGIQSVRDQAAARFERFKAEALNHEPEVIEPVGGIDEGQGHELLVVIALHGSGGRGEPMAESLAGSLTGAGVRAVVIAPDALRPHGNGGFSWTFVDEAEWYVEHLIEKYTRQYSVGRERVVLVGFSQGANILLSFIRGRPGLMSEIAGSVMVCGHIEDDLIAHLGSAAAPEADGESKGSEDQPRVYLMIGARDPWVKTYREGVGAFEDARIAVEMREMRGRGHEFPGGVLGSREFGRALEFLVEEE